MTPESLLAESERLIKVRDPKSYRQFSYNFMQVMTKVYDSVGGVPRESVNFENVIKPLIDLDGDIHTQSGALTVSQLESIPSSDIQP